MELLGRRGKQEEGNFMAVLELIAFVSDTFLCSWEGQSFCYFYCGGKICRPCRLISCQVGRVGAAFHWLESTQRKDTRECAKNSSPELHCASGLK